MTDAKIDPAERLAIEHACARLALDYAAFADSGRMDEWAELFAEDAEMELFGNVSKGRAAIRAGVGAGDASRQTMHVTSNIRTTALSADEASGEAYVVVYVGERAPGAAAATAPKLIPVIVGVYKDSYRRTPDGWRISRRSFSPTISASAPAA